MEKVNNTFIKEKIPNPKRRVEFEVGDIKQSDFIPQFKTKHWDNEANFSVRLKEDDYNGQVKEKKGKIEWSKGIKTARFYEVDVDDGGFEFEVEFSEKPDSNVLEYTIQSKEFDFFYQPKLTPEEIAEGRERPENVIGSYAVYHKTQKHNEINGKEYRTGKAFHIYRPFAVDAENTKVWCELNIDGETLTITMPQEFLDAAVYPVIIDPTFGYTSQGASSLADEVVNFAMRGDVAGTITDVNAYLKGGSPSTDDGANLKVFPNSAGSPNFGSPSYSSSFFFTPSTTYSLFTYSSLSVAITNPAWVGGTAQDGTGSGFPAVAYDTGGVSNYGAYRLGGATTLTSDRFSTYATYTASGSAIKTFLGLADASTKTVNGLARASVKTWEGLA